MSTASATLVAPTTSRLSSSGAPSLARLTRLEVRKSVDTRAGRWLLVGVAAIGVALTFVTVLAGGASDRTFADAAGNIQGTMTILPPVLGILLITSEMVAANRVADLCAGPPTGSSGRGEAARRGGPVAVRCPLRRGARPAGYGGGQSPGKRLVARYHPALQ
jgi:hypothetical protein